MNKSKNKGLDISIKSFITAIGVIFALMVATYILTLFVPAGEYTRIENSAGDLIIDTASPFKYTEGGIPFYKWLLSPFLVLGSSGNTTLIAVIAFLLVIGGIFSCLERRGLMEYMLQKTVHRFGKVRYGLMAVIIFFFMALGSMIGSFEECVPLVPIVVALSVRLGWDSLTGMGMSLLSVGCGFAAGICNPFTVGVAQQLAGLPMFSGVPMRILSFILIYALLFLFVFLHAKKVEKPVSTASAESAFVHSKELDRGVTSFVAVMSAGIALVISSGFIPAMQDYTMIIVAVMFLFAGILSCSLSGMKGSEMLKNTLAGIVGILPAVLMILMASSIKYTLEEAQILDTLLHGAIGIANHLPRFTVILFIYLLVLIMNFFIPSGSAKAFMLIPIIIPMAQIFNISPQLCILAFAFGDGFSNVFYPTNPALLISLGLADVSYTRWFRWSWKFQFANLCLTSLLLLLGLAIGY